MKSVSAKLYKWEDSKDTIKYIFYKICDEGKVRKEN